LLTVFVTMRTVVEWQLFIDIKAILE